MADFGFSFHTFALSADLIHRQNRVNLSQPRKWMCRTNSAWLQSLKKNKKFFPLWLKYNISYTAFVGLFLGKTDGMWVPLFYKLTSFDWTRYDHVTPTNQPFQKVSQVTRTYISGSLILSVLFNPPIRIYGVIRQRTTIWTLSTVSTSKFYVRFIIFNSRSKIVKSTSKCNGNLVACSVKTWGIPGIRLRLTFLLHKNIVPKSYVLNAIFRKSKFMAQQYNALTL
jgi:hypothetical protein